MLLWLVAAIGFVVCVVAWHLSQHVTWEEAATLFVVAAVLFNIQLHYIYNKATTDHYLVSGYVTSLIHRPPFSYQCGKHRCDEPERWIIEQRPHKPSQQTTITRSIHSGDGIEYCTGECGVLYDAPYTNSSCCNDTYAYYAILVDPRKFERTKLQTPSIVLRPYYNPVQASDEVVYDGADDIPYFKADDYNHAHRLIAAHVTAAQENKLEEVNARFSPQNISVGVIVTADNLYFEKLKHAWHQGKSNDFVIVVYSPDGKNIANTNVLAWNNYALQENMIEAISALPSADIDAMLTKIESTLSQGQLFSVADFSRYRFLNVKIPDRYYWKIFGFQALFFAYILILLKYNPNTKDKKLTWGQVGKMWDKHFSPPDKSWYFHPLTPTGLILYVGVPCGVAAICF